MAHSVCKILALLGLLAATLPQRSAAAQEPSLPGPWPQQRAHSAAASNQQCEACHVAIAREWRGSYHRRANSDPAFRLAVQREPMPFCRRCHAPEADPRRVATGWAAQNGVACVTCHELDGRITSGAGNNSPSHGRPHPLKRDARLSGDAACIRCHEFAFPDGKWRREPDYMQLTISEHRASPYADISCTDCHMPRVLGASGRPHRSHAFLAGHDQQTVRAALQVEAARSGDAVVLRLTPQRVGHALPTGDLFRRIVLTLTTEGEPHRRLEQRDLMRQLGNEQPFPGHPVRVVQGDDRLTGQTEHRFALPPRAAQLPVRWRVTYQRVVVPGSLHGGGGILDGEVLLASGVLLPDWGRATQ